MPAVICVATFGGPPLNFSASLVSQSGLLGSGLSALGQAAPGGSSAIVQFLPLVLIFGVFWFLVIRPQQKKTKEHQGMLNQLRAGDMVVTQGGLIGKVSAVKELELTVELQQGVRVRVLRTHILQKYTPGEGAKTETKADDKAS